MTPHQSPAPRSEGEAETGAGLTPGEKLILTSLGVALIAGLIGVSYFVWWLAGVIA